MSKSSVRSRGCAALGVIAFTMICATAHAGPAPSPWSGTPVNLPGTVQAENYDRGGQGVAFRDTTKANIGGRYRPKEAVDIMRSAEGGYIVSHFDTGEWLVYTVNVATAGFYDLEVRASAAEPGSAYHLEVDAMPVTEVIVVPVTGDWDTYQWVGKRRTYLAAGRHLITMASNQQYFGFDAIRVTSAEAASIDSSFGSARKLFSSGFEGVSVSQPVDCWGTGCWLEMVGTDAVSGYSWPGNLWGGGGKFLILSDPVVTTAQNIGNIAFNRVESVTGPRGAPSQALFQQITQNVNGTAPMGTAPTQNEFQFLPKQDPGDIYVSYWMKLQPDLVQKMTNLPPAPGVTGGGTWRAIFAAKTGGQTAWGGPADNGDYRIEAYVMTHGGTQPYWTILGDNNAGGNAPLSNNWSVENRNVPVPVGQWFKLEIFWHRSSGSDGRVWMAVNGQTLADRYGPNVGAWNLPINRIMAPIVYSGGAMPIYQWVDELEIWDGFPPSNGSNQPYAAH